MQILITGGTGLIGRALIQALPEEQITVLTRSPEQAETLLPAHVQCIKTLDDISDFNQFDAVINLAGEPIIDKRWNEHQKGIICSSRWGITEDIVNHIKNCDNPPAVFISGSAVGYYGNQDDRQIDESLEVESEAFSHTLCANWEKIALRAASEKTRVCLLRTGVVLSKEGGALKKMTLPYSLGLGGPIGLGKQFFPWIHIDDMVGGILHLLQDKNAQGVFNFTAPHPVTNRTFSKTLAETLRRPHVLFTPSMILKFILGESSQLLLDSQKVLPKALEKSGYQFQFSEVSTALDNLLRVKR